MHTYACMFVRIMYVCMYACMFVCMYVCTYVCMYRVCMYVCLPSIPYHIRFNFCGVKLLRIADFSNFWGAFVFRNRFLCGFMFVSDSTVVLSM